MQLFLELALLLLGKRTDLAKQVGHLFFGLGFHTGQKVQEKGLGVKD